METLKPPDEKVAEFSPLNVQSTLNTSGGLGPPPIFILHSFSIFREFYRRESVNYLLCPDSVPLRSSAARRARCTSLLSSLQKRSWRECQQPPYRNILALLAKESFSLSTLTSSFYSPS